MIVVYTLFINYSVKEGVHGTISKYSMNISFEIVVVWVLSISGSTGSNCYTESGKIVSLIRESPL